MGRVVAACTSAIMRGEGSSEVMSQPAPTSCIHVPMLENSAAIQSARNTECRKGLQALAPSAAARVGVTSSASALVRSAVCPLIEAARTFLEHETVAPERNPKRVPVVA